jgi:hypothetical protein
VGVGQRAADTSHHYANLITNLWMNRLTFVSLPCLTFSSVCVFGSARCSSNNGDPSLQNPEPWDISISGASRERGDLDRRVESLSAQRTLQRNALLRATRASD